MLLSAPGGAKRLRFEQVGVVAEVLPLLDARTQLVDYLKSGQLTWRENARLAWSLANLEAPIG